MTENGNTYAGGARRLDGRVAVVTGSSSGNGRSIALTLAAEGAHVVCADLRPSAVAGGYEADADLDTDELVRRAGRSSVYVEANVTVPEQVDELADRAIARFGRVDIWVNNAGIAGAALIADQSVEDFQRILTTNVVGTWLGCKSAVRVMRGQELTGPVLGRLINVGSIAGSLGQGRLSGYAASKGAVHSLTKELAVELAADRITVNAILPGYLPTNLSRGVFENTAMVAKIRNRQPWPDLPENPAHLGRTVAFLASDDAAWITGVLLPVDGGVLAS